MVAVYWLTATSARHASQGWIGRVKAQLASRGLPEPSHLNSYQHFLRFGNAMLDKVASWRGELRLDHDVVFAEGAKAALGVESPQGKLLLASHLGDVEACRALAQLDGTKTINALVFSENAQRFKQIMQEMAPQAGLNLLPVNDIGPDTAIVAQREAGSRRVGGDCRRPHCREAPAG